MLKKIIITTALVILAAACTSKNQAAPSTSSTTSMPPASSSVPAPTTTKPSPPTTPAAPQSTVSPAHPIKPTGGMTPVAPNSNQTLQNETWGNSQLILNIGTSSSTYSLACSSGTITQPFTLINGQFYLNGKYYPGGPPHVTVGPNGQPEAPNYNIVLSGSVTGTTMHFMIGSGQSYDLTQGTSFTLAPQACPV